MARQKSTHSGMTHEGRPLVRTRLKQQKLQQQGRHLATGTQNGSQPPRD